jgi:glutamate racemase
MLERLLPNEKIIYFGDSARMPYGGRTKEEICRLAVQDAAFLNSFGVKAMLVACGTMSSNAMETLRGEFDTPFFGIVDAACRAAVGATRSKRVGVIATQATVRSGVYEAGIKALDGEIEVISHACPNFAQTVEQGHFRLGDPIAERAVAEELACFLGSGIDTLLLGCTHYPLLSQVISSFLGGEIVQISAGAEAAQELVESLRQKKMIAPEGEAGSIRCYTSGDEQLFRRGGELFLGHGLDCQKHVIQ